MAQAVQAAAAAFLADRAAPPALALQDTAQQDEFLFAAVAARVKAEEDAREEATARRAAEQARTIAELAQLESSAEGAQLRASGERRAAAASACATALLETAASQVATLEEELAQAKQDKEQSVQVSCEAAAAAARAAAAAARSVEAVQQAAGADVVAEGLRLEAAAASLNERKRQLAREAAVTQQESSEAYLRCYQRCQAQVSAAKAAEIESRKAEVEAAERLTEALASATSKRQIFEVELRRQLQAADEASEVLQRQVQATKAADAVAALSSRVTARCMREGALAKAWRSLVVQRLEAARLKRLLAVASARLRRPTLFTAWRAICAEVQKERGRKAAEQTEALFPSLMAGLTEVRRETEKALLTAGVELTLISTLPSPLPQPYPDPNPNPNPNPSPNPNSNPGRRRGA
mgnify:CR=1 FL=1